MASNNPPKNPFLDGSGVPPATVSPPPNPPVAPVTPLAPSRPPTSPPSLPPTSFPAPAIADRILAPTTTRRPWRWVMAVLVVLLVAAGTVMWWRGTRESPTLPSEPTPSTPTSSEVQPTRIPTPRETETDDGALYASENFKAGEIVLGGELEFLQGESDIAPLEITGIRGEAFTEKNKQEVKLVVTWRTNRLSLATVEYSKGVGQAKKNVTENDYAFNHSLIIPNLDPASTYIYTIKSEDRFGNVAESDPHAVFTGARSVSLFDLIAGAIGDVFGWAVDK